MFAGVAEIKLQKNKQVFEKKKNYKIEYQQCYNCGEKIIFRMFKNFNFIRETNILMQMLNMI
jgi:hypothetical protein